MHPTRTDSVAGSDGEPTPPDYWYGLINEAAAAAFLGLTIRKMQKDRQTGNGPQYIRISSRCIRYRRIDLRAHAEAQICTSTAEAAA